MITERRELNAATWRTSSYSGSSNNCVEVAPLPANVGVRDTKDRDGGSLVVSRSSWTAFIGSVTLR